MWAAFSPFQLSEGAWWAIAVAVMAAAWIIPATINGLAREWRRARESEHLAALKQTMVERGMSADEIERVIKAGNMGKGTADKSTTA
jgi:hypothetical protein